MMKSVRVVEAKNFTILDALKWVINIMVLVVGFFVVGELRAVDKVEQEIHSIQLYQAGDIERDIQEIQKLNEIIELLSEAKIERKDLGVEVERVDDRIDNLLILNPQLKSPKRK
jgi:hypothetical protein